MNNILMSAKRFLSNKNTVSIIGVLVCILVLYIGYNWRINQQLTPVLVPYANRTIQPRTEITEDMISYTKVPPSYLQGNYVISVAQILSKYSNYNTIIPKGSLFYSDALIDKRDLPDEYYGTIKAEYTVFNFPVTMASTYGKSMYPGNTINIYFKAFDDDGKLMVGKLVSNVQILAVKDSSGNHVFEDTTANRIPAYLIFAVPEDIHLLLRKALYLTGVSAELIPVPNSINYTTDVPEISSEQIREFILSKTTLIADEELPSVEDILPTNP